MWVLIIVVMNVYGGADIKEVQMQSYAACEKAKVTVSNLRGAQATCIRVNDP